MPTIPALLCAAALATAPQSGWAWGHPGHQLVGSLADTLIAGTPAARQVAAILGPAVKTLQVAAPWPDCVREVERQASGRFVYDATSRFHSPVCVPFEGRTERARMEDFARRNWDNCPDSAHTAAACHGEFHYTDIAVQRGSYATGHHGSTSADIVQATAAAIAVLRGGPPASPPFDLRDHKEALLLLAHLLGDLHQPLHVGALYLDDAGQPIDPDSPGSPAGPAAETRGGNRLEVGGSTTLHAEWDAIPYALTLTGLATRPGQQRRLALLAQARAVPATPGPVLSWPAVWAGDSVLAARGAFQGLRFSRKGALDPQDWAVQFKDQAGYRQAREQLQQQQLVKAAARLAATLRAIWP